MAKKKKDQDNWGGVRVHRYEVGKLLLDEGEDRKSVYDRWHEVRREVSRAINIYLQSWYHWHWQRGSLDELEAQLAAFREWENTDKKTRGAKPKWTVPREPPSKDSPMYLAIRKRCRLITVDTVSTLCKHWRGNLLTGKDTKGRMQKWIAILLGLENLASSHSDIIIPIKPGAFTLELTDDGRFACTVDTAREDVPGKKTGRVFKDRFLLWLKRRDGSSAKLLERCISGEFRPRNCSLQWHEGKKKWFLLLAYQTPKVHLAAGDPQRVATLVPAADHPWELWLPGRDRPVWIGGDGRHVSSARRRIFGQRESRNRNYQHAGSANRGHGLRRATAPARKLQRRWKDFVKSTNHHATSMAVRIAEENGCGKFVYEQPTGVLRDESFLATAGKKGLRTQTHWDWHQVASHLKYKAERMGIHVVVAKQEKEEAA